LLVDFLYTVINEECILTTYKQYSKKIWFGATYHLPTFLLTGWLNQLYGVLLVSTILVVWQGTWFLCTCAIHSFALLAVSSWCCGSHKLNHICMSRLYVLVGFWTEQWLTLVMMPWPSLVHCSILYVQNYRTEMIICDLNLQNWNAFHLHNCFAQ
jgi:hypothetical protein